MSSVSARTMSEPDMAAVIRSATTWGELFAAARRIDTEPGLTTLGRHRLWQRYSDRCLRWRGIVPGHLYRDTDGRLFREA